jgi:hypothetical protein
MTAEREAKTRSCWFESGLKGRLKDVSERRMPKSTTMPITSKMITFLRLVFVAGRVGVEADKIQKRLLLVSISEFGI